MSIRPSIVKLKSYEKVIVFSALLLGGVGLYITSALIGHEPAMEQAAAGLIGAAVGGAGALLRNGHGS